MGKGDAEKVVAGAGELLGPNNAMIESLDILPSVALVSVYNSKLYLIQNSVKMRNKNRTIQADFQAVPTFGFWPKFD